jgi:hypothetical protein
MIFAPKPDLSLTRDIREYTLESRVKVRSIYSSKVWVFVCILACAISVDVAAQSSHLPRGSNGSSFEAGIALDDWHFATAFGKLSYSIGGILDVGASLQYGFTSVSGVSAYDVRLGITYSSLALKQDESVPISARISGSYGFSKVGSSFLEENDLAKEGIGYDISLAIFRDFFFTPSFSFRIGARADFHSYSYTTDLIYTPPDTVVTQYPVYQREEQFYFGGETGVSFKLTPRLGLAILGELVFDTDLVPIFRPLMRVITSQ